MRGVWLATLLLLAPAVQAAVSITNAWSRATPPTTTVGVVYFELVADAADELIAIEAGGVAERVEVHVSSNDDGTMKMRPLTSISFAPGRRVRFQPSGMHVMLIGLREPLVAGATIPLIFKFRHAATVRVEAKIIGPGEREPHGK
jgi:copper(I)-binding protein